MNFTHREKYFFYFLLSQFLLSENKKNLLEKEKTKLTQNSTDYSARPAKQPGPPQLRDARPHPGRKLGLGRQCRVAARACLGREMAHSISAVRVDPTAIRAHSRNKTGDRSGALEP